MEFITAIGTALIGNAPYIIGFIMPFIVEVLNTDVKNDHERYLVAVMSCILAAAFLHWPEILAGKPEQAAYIFGIIFAESNTIYKLFYQPIKKNMQQEEAIKKDNA